MTMTTTAVPDFIEGVATAITPSALLEAVMVKGYQTLVDERTTVSYRDGMAAAVKLAELLCKEEGEYDNAHRSLVREPPRHRLSGSSPSATWMRKSDNEC
jgi:hypothetical protein